MAVKHTKVATTADDGTSEVGTNEWNDNHIIDNNTVTDAMVDAHTTTKITVPSTLVTGLTATDISDFDAEVANNTAVAANTAKTGITSGQAGEITTNTAKISYSTAASDAVALNTAKTGITSVQASAISANTLKVGLTNNSVDSDHYIDASIDSAHLSSGLTIADPTLTFSINAVTGNYTTVLADAGKIITSSSGSAVVITLPPSSSVDYPIGSSINVISIGAGLTNFAIGAGVTINSTGAVPAAPVLRIAHSSATAIKIATDTWQVVGDIS